jgi:hypothetical protein
MSLRRRLAEFGFESNDDYSFQIDCLMRAEVPHLRALQIAGDGGRRKTALANALAQALEFPRVLYHDFSQAEPPPAPIVIMTNEDGTASDGPNEEPPTAFERALTEVCAFSEGERAVLILDQLQLADFHDQTRLFQFIQTHVWSTSAGSVKANAKQLLLMLISEDTLYHPLAHVSYRIWADASGGRFDYRPEEFGLGVDAREMFAALAVLFDALATVPTTSELRKLLADALANARTEEHLRHCIFGWMEHIDRARLFSPTLTPLVHEAVMAINRFQGMDHIEIGSPL